MITTGAKFWAAAAAVAAVAAVVYAAASGGEKLGTYVLAFTVAVAALLATLLVARRDGTAVPAADPEAAVVPGSARVPGAIWPVVAAFGVGLLIAGVAAADWLAWLGAALLVVTILEWMVQGWAERATGDEGANRELRNHLMYPFEIPLGAAAVVAVMVLAFSRVLLAVPQVGSIVIAGVAAAVVLGLAAVLAARPRVSPSIVSAVIVVGAVALIGSGIAGAVVGERDFEHHGEEHAEEDEDGQRLEGDEDTAAEEGDEGDDTLEDGEEDAGEGEGEDTLEEGEDE